MANVGLMQPLTVTRRARQGVYLDGDDLGEILLPNRDADESLQPGDSVNVFIYHDSEDRLVATTSKPLLQRGDVGLLKVVSVTRVGTFLDWGLLKDLLLPFAEQRGTPEEGRSLLVKVIQNHDGRLVASANLDRHLTDTADCYQQGDEVRLVVAQQTELGYKVVVDGRYWGLLPLADVREPLRRGQRITGYIQRLRPDQRLSVSLHAPGAAKSDELAEKIVARLQAHEGFLPLSDKSSPEDIFAHFRVSKSAFKQSIGKLYKERRIVIGKDGIHLPS